MQSENQIKIVVVFLTTFILSFLLLETYSNKQEKLITDYHNNNNIITEIMGIKVSGGFENSDFKQLFYPFEGINNILTEEGKNNNILYTQICRIIKTEEGKFCPIISTKIQQPKENLTFHEFNNSIKQEIENKINEYGIEKITRDMTEEPESYFYHDLDHQYYNKEEIYKIILGKLKYKDFIIEIKTENKKFHSHYIAVISVSKVDY